MPSVVFSEMKDTYLYICIIYHIMQCPGHTYKKHHIYNADDFILNRHKIVNWYLFHVATKFYSLTY